MQRATSSGDPSRWWWVSIACSFSSPTSELPTNGPCLLMALLGLPLPEKQAPGGTLHQEGAGWSSETPQVQGWTWAAVGSRTEQVAFRSPQMQMSHLKACQEREWGVTEPPAHPGGKGVLAQLLRDLDRWVVEVGRTALPPTPPSFSDTHHQPAGA